MKIKYGSLLALVLFLCACSGGVADRADTPEKRKEIAQTGGELAAAAYLAATRPDPEDRPMIEGIAFVINKVKVSLQDYTGGGFFAVLPEIEAAIDDKIADNVVRIGAKKFAKILLSELDQLFEKHPEWEKLDNEVTGIVLSFATGASITFEDYLQVALEAKQAALKMEAARAETPE